MQDKHIPAEGNERGKNSTGIFRTDVVGGPRVLYPSRFFHVRKSKKVPIRYQLQGIFYKVFPPQISGRKVVSGREKIHPHIVGKPTRLNLPTTVRVLSIFYTMDSTRTIATRNIPIRMDLDSNGIFLFFFFFFFRNIGVSLASHVCPIKLTFSQNTIFFSHANSTHVIFYFFISNLK